MDLQNILAFLNDERQLNAAGTGMAVGGNLFSAFQTIQAGRDAKKSADFQAEQLRVNAGQQRAAGQHAAEDVERQNRLIASRALAVAAASGGGASDPTVINIIAKNAAEGAYRRDVALYGGEEKARAMEAQAMATEYSGESAKYAATVNGVAQGTIGTAGIVARGAAKDNYLSMYAKYAGGGPTKTTGHFSRGDRTGIWADGVWND